MYRISMDEKIHVEVLRIKISKMKQLFCERDRESLLVHMLAFNSRDTEDVYFFLDNMRSY